MEYLERKLIAQHLELEKGRKMNLRTFARRAHRTFLACTLLAMPMLGAATPANASTVMWGFVQGQGAMDVSGNFSMSATDLGNEWVRFTVEHTGAVTGDGYIRGIYFEDKLSLFWDNGWAATPEISPENRFQWDDVNPAHLPGSDDFVPAFETAFGFQAYQVGGGTNSTTIKAGESISIDLKLLDPDNIGWDQVAGAIGNNLRIGLFVQDAIQDVNGEWVSIKFTTVPLPAAGWGAMALLSAIGGVAAVRRRWAASQA